MAANKYLASNPTTGVPTETYGTVVSAGTANANQIVALDGSGHLDLSVLPSGVGVQTRQIVASEALAAGALVNIWNNAGSAAVRNADGSTTGKYAHGFVLSAVASGATATVYQSGAENTAAASLTPGPQFLSASTPGKTQSTPPTAAGQTVQIVGSADTTTTFLFEPYLPYVLS